MRCLCIWTLISLALAVIGQPKITVPETRKRKILSHPSPEVDHPGQVRSWDSGSFFPFCSVAMGLLFLKSLRGPGGISISSHRIHIPGSRNEEGCRRHASLKDIQQKRHTHLPFPPSALPRRNWGRRCLVTR